LHQCTLKPIGGVTALALLKILVVDDFDSFRELARSILRERTGWVVGEASDGLEAVQKADESKPDVIVLDIGMPKLSGIEAARRICTLSPNSKIIFCTQENSPEVIEECLRLGQGYIAKANAGKQLLTAIDAVLQGKQFVG
jgi:DNA-binding NarL/FixJ family response regulator